MKPKPPARRTSAGGELDEIVLRLRDRLGREMDLLDKELAISPGKGSEHRLKAISLLSRLVQNMNEMLSEITNRREQTADSRVDVVEFRRQLEAQIDRLVEAGECGAFSGELGKGKP